MNLQASIRIPRRARDGETGDGIVNTVISYAKSESGTTPPSTGWASTLPTPTQGWYLWTRTVTTYRIRPATTTYSVSSYAKNGEDGKNGMPGQIPIQKEWVVGDTHRNTDEIVDYIYVRGANKEQSYWYKLSAKGTTTAGAPPENGESRAGYERIDWLKELAVKVLLAEEANVAGFIFKDNKLISQRGTVGGVDADYSDQAGFVPNLILDGTEGDVKITGTVNATSGSFKGKVSVPFVIIDSFTSGSIINLDDSFNISTHSVLADKTIYLPIDEKYNGVVCHIHNGGRTQNEGDFEVKIQGGQYFEGRKRGIYIQSITIEKGQIGAFICLKDISGSIGWACTNYSDLQL